MDGGGYLYLHVRTCALRTPLTYFGNIMCSILNHCAKIWYVVMAQLATYAFHACHELGTSCLRAYLFSIFQDPLAL